MTSAADALSTAQAAGIQVALDGPDLVLETLTAPPRGVLDVLAEHKAGIVALLRDAGETWDNKDWQAFYDERAGVAEYDRGQPRAVAEAVAFQSAVVEWINRRVTPTESTACAFCGEADDAGLPLPFLARGGHAWVHGEWHAAWMAALTEQAVTAMVQMGVSRPAKWHPGYHPRLSRTS